MSLAFAFALGNFAFAAAPLVFPAGTGTYDAEILSYIAWATAIALPLCAGGALLFVPEGKTVETAKVRYIATLRDAIRNGPLLRFLSLFLFTDRTSVVSGKSVSECVDLGGRRIRKKKQN